MKMQRFVPYFGIIIAFAIGILIVVSFNNAKVPRAPVVVTIPAIAGTTTKSSATSSQTTIPLPTPPTPITTAEKSSPRRETEMPSYIAQSPTTIPPSSVNQSALDSSASTLREALINIICQSPAGSAIHSISGSGIIVDPKGIILTNAHIGQYFLLADHDIYCVIRSGNPATDKYEAEIIYTPSSWLRANSDVLTKTSPKGTGEYDFAFLAISKSVTNDPLPSSFPYIPLASVPPITGVPIIIASYGAQFLASSQISSSLFPTVVFGSVKDIFTFGTNTIDVLALGGSAAAQEGSSGGGVADSSGNLVGTITTSTISGSTDTRALDAITASYIRAEYASETGESLDLFLSKPTAVSISDFAQQIPSLEAIITNGF